MGAVYGQLRSLAKTKRESEETESEEQKGGKTVCKYSRMMIEIQENDSLLMQSQS